MANADDPLADLSAAEQRALVELAQARVDGRVNRRDVLAGGAGMAVGAAGLASLTGGGSAQPTGDEGSVGTQSNRVEAWISEADANSIDTGDLTGSYPTRVRAIDSSGVVASIDPSTTSTPVQDAVNAISSNFPFGGGTVLLPPANVQEAGTPAFPSNVSMIGHGMETSGIEITATGSGVRGLEINGSQMRFIGFRIKGAGYGATQGPCIVPNANVHHVTFDHIRIVDWPNKALSNRATGSQIWQSKFGVFWAEVDAGGQSNPYIIDLQNGATARNVFDNLQLIGRDTGSGADSGGIYLLDAAMQVNQLNMNGTIGTSGNIIDCERGMFQAATAMYEPSSNRNSTPTAVIGERGDFTVHVDRLRIAEGGQGAGHVNHAYRVYGADGGGSTYGFVEIDGSPLIGDKVHLDADIANFPSFYFGPSSDVNNDTGGTLSQPIVCLGDLVTKTSTGTGP